jgi:hypothetical protein
MQEAGTQTAGLAFGGILPTGSKLLQQKNMMEQLGQLVELWVQQEDF